MITAKVVNVRPMTNAVRVTIDINHQDRRAFDNVVNRDYEIALTHSPRQQSEPEVDTHPNLGGAYLGMAASGALAASPVEEFIARTQTTAALSARLRAEEARAEAEEAAREDEGEREHSFAAGIDAADEGEQTEEPPPTDGMEIPGFLKREPSDRSPFAE